MRLLLVQPSALERRAGAAQIAINLGEALRQVGHDVEIYSPRFKLGRGFWWARERRARRALSDFLVESRAFDVVDAPPWLVPPLGQRFVARSVQPELEYLAVGEQRAGSGRMPAPRRFVHRLHAASVRRGVVRGWRLASRILCLGTADLEQMRLRFPALLPSLRMYRACPSSDDREALRRALLSRRAPVRLEEARFLWIGRWSPHKGLDLLAAFARDFFAAYPNARLTLAGTGTVDVSWEGFDFRAIPSVRILATFERSELGTLLAEHDAGLFTSEVEGWGLGMQEMLESGLPVYAVEAGAVSDLRSWFPTLLRPFPPVVDGRLPDRVSAESLGAYDASFRWPTLAAEYVEAIS